MRRGIERNISNAFLRITRCPQIMLRVGFACTRALQRTRSALTGNCLAGFHARILIEDSLTLARSAFLDPFRISSEVTFDAVARSDNIGVCASSMEAAIHNFQCWEQHLNTLGVY